MATAAPSHPMSIMVIEVDPGDATNGTSSLANSAMDVVREIVRHSLRDDDSLGTIGDRGVVMLANTNAEEARSIGERSTLPVCLPLFADRGKAFHDDSGRNCLRATWTSPVCKTRSAWR